MRTKGLVLAGAMTAVLAWGPASAHAASTTVSCSASSVATLGSLLAPRCQTPPVACSGACAITGTVTARSAVRVGRVGGRLKVGSVLSAACVASASSCTGGSPAAPAPPGSYVGACAWDQPGLLWVLTSVSCTVTAVEPDIVPDGKVNACNYSGTPGVDEVLQVNHSPIEISASAIAATVDPEDPSFVVVHDPVQVGDVYVEDAGFFGVVVAVAGDPRATIEDCPGYAPPA